MIGDQSPTSRRPVGVYSVQVYIRIAQAAGSLGTRCIMVYIFNMEVPHQMQLLRLQSGLPRLNTLSSAAWEKMQISKRGVFLSFARYFQRCCLAPRDLHRRAAY